jgi:hypothetical protein
MATLVGAATGARPLPTRTSELRRPTTGRPPALTLTALAVTMAAMAIQSAACSDWRRTARPISAANTGLTLMNTPKNLVATRRRASRSATIGTAEHKTPAVAARPSATAVT